MNTFLELAKERYSVRKFKDTPVEEEKIKMILEAGRVAPTARNNQPQKIYVARSREALDKLNEISPCIYGAPLVFIVCYDLSRAARGNIRENYQFGETDAAIVCTHMMLEAKDLGVGTCWVGMFNGEDVKKAFDLPEGIEPSALLPTGYPDEEFRPSDKHTAKREENDTISYI